MIKFKETYPKIPTGNNWGAVLTSVVDCIGMLQLAVKKIDERVANLESCDSKKDGEC